MDISILKQELLDKKLRPFYVFTGEELALQDIYINKIKEISELDIVRADSVASILSNLFSKSLFKMPSKLYVIRGDEEYLKTEKVWDNYINAKDFKGNILILLYTDISKTSKFYKQHESILTQFDLISASLLKNRLNAITGMPLQFCEELVKLCGGNYGRIKNELYKLSVYARIHNLDWLSSYLQARQHNLIHEDIGDIIFDFTKCIEERNIKKAYELWPKMKYTGDGTMRVLTVLYNSFRQILMVQSTPVNERTEQVLGMTKGQIYITSQKCNRYNIYEVVNIVKTLRYLEKGIKTGEVSEEYAMNYLMGTIW